MKKIDYLSTFCDLLKYKIVEINEEEYVFFANNELGKKDFYNQIIYDHTEFEAIQNRVYLINSLSKNEFQKAYELGESLADILMTNLKANFPNKKFYVYVNVICSKYDGLIVRFHQIWENESPYYKESIGDRDAVIIRKG